MSLQNTSTASTGRFLGIEANTSNANEAKKPNPKSSLDSKKLKYALQRKAQSILFDYSALKQHRVCSCHRNVASDGVVVYRDSDGSDARFGNLMTCGSVWVCPICNSKITEARRIDMHKAQTEWLLQGGKCLLMTLTTEHEADQPLSEVLDLMTKAVNDFNNHRSIKAMFGTSVASLTQSIDKGKPLKSVTEGKHARLGYVRSLEVTYGANGWHPHFHTVMFMDNDLLLTDTQSMDLIKAVWVSCLIKHGADSTKLNHLLERALDIRGGDYVSDYINKFGREPLKLNGWSIAHEVTKANSKIGLRSVNGDWHYTPFQLLALATDGDEEAAQKFKEFAVCFEGKRMNYWTNGLKQWFGIGDVEDEALAQEDDDPSLATQEFVIRLDTQQWKEILSCNARSELLAVAAAFGKDGVLKLLEELPNRPKSFRGWFKDHARPDFSRFYH